MGFLISIFPPQMGLFFFPQRKKKVTKIKSLCKVEKSRADFALVETPFATYECYQFKNSQI